MMLASTFKRPREEYVQYLLKKGESDAQELAKDMEKKILV